MNLELNNETIETELNKSATEAISQAFGSYEIQSAIKKDVAERVVKDGLVKALAASVDKLDIDRITEALATEMQRTITKIVVVTVSVHVHLHGRKPASIQDLRDEDGFTIRDLPEGYSYAYDAGTGIVVIKRGEKVVCD